MSREAIGVSIEGIVKKAKIQCSTKIVSRAESAGSPMYLDEPALLFYSYMLALCIAEPEIARSANCLQDYNWSYRPTMRAEEQGGGVTQQSDSLVSSQICEIGSATRPQNRLKCSEHF